MQAVLRALRSLGRPDIFWHMLWPGLLAVAIWMGVIVWVWGDAAEVVLCLVGGWPVLGEWVVSTDSARVAMAFAVHFFLILLAVPLVFVTSAILVSLLALPFMLDRVSATDYTDIAQRRGGSIVGSMSNSLWALLIFLVAVLLTLPLWLIPGLGLILSVMLAAWLNKRCYGYDALMNHADRQEMRDIVREQRGGLYALGIGAGLLAYVPVLNLFVPAFSGLAFVHYLLEALRRRRGGGRV